MVVGLMMLGDRAKQIAWKLKISLHTVNSHMANIKQKLECSTNFEVGYRLGWFWYHQEHRV
jgi:DNA-binding CsgD family transcriptional regulator